MLRTTIAELVFDVFLYAIYLLSRKSQRKSWRTSVVRIHADVKLSMCELVEYTVIRHRYTNIHSLVLFQHSWVITEDRIWKKFLFLHLLRSNYFATFSRRRLCVLRCCRLTSGGVFFFFCPPCKFDCRLADGVLALKQRSSDGVPQQAPHSQEFNCNIGLFPHH